MRFQTLARSLTLASFALGFAALASAQRGGPPNDFYRYNYNAAETAAIKDAPPVVTEHQVTVGGETINYSAHVGFMPIHNATTQVTEGHLFYVYYAKSGVTDQTKRPIWFLFNGGPGAASIWLHMGAFGPKMVKLGSDGLSTAPPYTFVDNPNTLLDTGDLVFIDAMGTGFSRPD
ncbi:MAG TPA: peptidase S10, partial [Terriglobales bacterium]